MTKIDLEHRIMQNTHELPVNLLYEVVDFVEFLKARHNTKTRQQQATEHDGPTPDLLTRLPRHRLGRMASSLRREEIYDDAR